MSGGSRSALVCFRLSPLCPARRLHTFHLLRPARHYPRVWIQRSSFERQRDLNPPDQCAAQRTLRASPPPQTARPGSHELPVDTNRDHRWGFPCCVWSPVSACRRQYPGRIAGIVRSYSPIDCGLPRTYGGSAPALFFSRPAQRSLSLRPAYLLSRLKAALYTRGFSSFVTSTAAPIATGRSEPVPRAGLPRCGPAPFTAHAST